MQPTLASYLDHPLASPSHCSRSSNQTYPQGGMSERQLPG
jgi:hypothetical protein